MTIALRARPEAKLDPHRQRGPTSVAVARATRRITDVALIPGAGIVPKHSRDRLSLTTTLREKSMPVAKHLSYVRSRSRTERSRRIDGPPFAHQCVHHDETPHTLPQRASLPRLAIPAVSVASRSIFRTATQLADSAGDIPLTIASWMLTGAFAGCAAYAMAMYGIPEAMNHEEGGAPMPSAPPAPTGNSSRPNLHVILADTERDIRASEIASPPNAAQPCAGARCAVRSEQTPGARSGWRTAIIAAAVLLLSRFREGYARHRAIAEPRNLSLRDVGISCADSEYIARHGARPE